MQAPFWRRRFSSALLRDGLKATAHARFMTDAVEGGAVAHGQPIGAAGGVLTTKLIHPMRRDGLTHCRGIVFDQSGGS